MGLVDPSQAAGKIHLFYIDHFILLIVPKEALRREMFATVKQYLTSDLSSLSSGQLRDIKKVINLEILSSVDNKPNSQTYMERKCIVLSKENKLSDLGRV